MVSKSKKTKQAAIGATATALALAGLGLVAKSKKGDSVFENDPEQKNPLEGKKVVFVEDESDSENADGEKGHLEATGEAELSQSIYDQYVKRGIDICLSFGGLVLLSPVFAATALAIKIEDPGPVLFTQKRVGRNKQYFKLHKFRSMKVSTPHDVPTHMLDNPDQYITKVGKFIRAHSLDELPQIWDIFIGNMAVIGPRPGLWNQDILTSERDKYGANDVRPGLTGWAQINGRDELELQKKAKLDGEYVKNESLVFDAKCFLGTISKVGHDDSVVEGGTGSMGASEGSGQESDDEFEGLKILVVCQYYWPEPFNVSAVCEGLVKRGHKVTVVTGRPNYPEGDLYPGYEGDEHLDEIRNGVRVLRTKIAPRKTGAVNRILNYYSFAAMGAKRVEDAGADFDVVFVFQLSPVMMADPALAYAKKHGVPVLHYVIDLWPESLLTGGITKDSAIYKLFARDAKRIYSSADTLAMTSPAFGGYLSNLIGRHIEAVYLPQFAEDMFDALVPDEDIVGSDLFPNGKLNVLFAGNVGAAQSVKTLIEAAALLQDEPFAFHIVGSGTELENCKVLASELELSNVIFHGRHPLEEMPAYYANADAMVATFSNDPILGYTLPRKIQSYMAAGKPVIGTVVGEAKRVLEEAQCGFCCEAENPQALAECCREMAALTEEDRIRLGERAKLYCKENYSRERFFDTLVRELTALKGAKHGC